MSSFIHLRNHTQYSLQEGSIPVKKLISKTKEHGAPAVGITDSNAMFGVLEFSSVAKESGVKPIVGCQVHLADEAGTGELALYASSEEGYVNLMRLSRNMYMREGSNRYLTLDDLREHSAGVICLTGGPRGPLTGHILSGDDVSAENLMGQLSDIYGDRLYVELQRHPDEDGVVPVIEADTENALINMAYDMDIPLVATNDNRFISKDGYEANDALISIKQKTSIDYDTRRVRYTDQHYMKTPEEMEELFADLPEALENTMEIATRCSYIVPKRPPILPKFADDEASEIRKQAHAGLAERLAEIEAVADEKEYKERLDFELDIIEKMGFPGYFLIVSDFIQWAKDNDIPVGPGRGSGAGSLVAYALKITDLDPLRYGLLFERFLNPERVSMPDFDIDFCMDRREEVIHYVQEKYGSDRVGQIITFGGLLSKGAVKGVGRALGVSYNKTNNISNLIPMKGAAPVGLSEALEMEPRLTKLIDEDAEVERLMSLSAGIEGLLSNASTHAAGVVIADRPVEELVPIYRDPESDMPATQFNMKWVEPAGLVKFDFLGLKTLTVMKRAEQMIKETTGDDVDVSRLPVDDENTYKLLADADTVAVFQVESAGMMDALRQMKPDRIEDIIALVALYRPGPMSNIPVYCDVKNGRREITSVHPLIDEILEETQGIIVYQEQVMEVARKMAGYTLGGADLLRRAMGKKIAAEMAKERPKFIEGSIKNGVDEKKAGEVFDLLEKFADYGFNKSHAAAYGVITYQTAWLKANYPVPFMASVMSCDSHLTDKLSQYKREADRMGIRTVPPSINKSGVDFSAVNGEIVYGLSALKGVGAKAVQPIVEERIKGGVFKDLADFGSRVDLKAVGKKTLTSLIASGALDELEPDRARLMEGLPALVSWSVKKREMSAGPIQDLFSSDFAPPTLPKVKPWTNEERMTREHEAVGFYLTGHPLDEVLPTLRRIGVKTYDEVATDISLDGQSVTLCGTVSKLEEKTGKSGKRFAFLGMSDPKGGYESMLFSKTLEQFRNALAPGNSVVIQARCEFQDDQPRLSIQNVMPVEKARPKTPATGILIRTQSEQSLDDIRSVVLSGDKSEPQGTVKVISPSDDGGEKVQTLSAKASFGKSVRDRLLSIPGVVSLTETGDESRISAKKAPVKEHLIGNKGVRGGDRAPWDINIDFDELKPVLHQAESLRKGVFINTAPHRKVVDKVEEIDIPF